MSQRDRIANDYSTLGFQYRDLEMEYQGIKKALEKKESEIQKLQGQVLEGERHAFSFTVFKSINFGLLKERRQLTLRINCLGDYVIELENNVMDRKIIPALDVKDVESDMGDPKAFTITLKESTLIGTKIVEKLYSDDKIRVLKNLKNFLRVANQNCKNNFDYQPVQYNRGFLNMIRHHFVG